MMIASRPALKPAVAMTMPGADLWVGMVLGPLPGHVTVEVGDHKLEYDNVQGPDGLRLEGQMDGKPFEVATCVTSDNAVNFAGDTPLGPVDTFMRAGGGGFGYDGVVGGVEVSEMLALGGSHLAYLGGTIQGLEFNAFASKGENNTVVLEGTLGEDRVHETLSVAPDGEWLIEGEIAGVPIRETIKRTSQ